MEEKGSEAPERQGQRQKREGKPGSHGGMKGQSRQAWGQCKAGCAEEGR